MRYNLSLSLVGHRSSLDTTTATRVDTHRPPATSKSLSALVSRSLLLRGYLFVLAAGGESTQTAISMSGEDTHLVRTGEKGRAEVEQKGEILYRQYRDMLVQEYL